VVKGRSQAGNQEKKRRGEKKTEKERYRIIHGERERGRERERERERGGGKEIIQKLNRQKTC
jgi:hypothetical protein